FACGRPPGLDGPSGCAERRRWPERPQNAVHTIDAGRSRRFGTRWSTLEYAPGHYSVTARSLPVPLGAYSLVPEFPQEPILGAHSHTQFACDLGIGSTGDDERTDLPLPGGQLAASLTPCLAPGPLGSEARGQGRAPAGEIGHRGSVGLGDR